MFPIKYLKYQISRFVYFPKFFIFLNTKKKVKNSNQIPIITRTKYDVRLETNLISGIYHIDLNDIIIMNRCNWHYIIFK